MFGKWYRCWSFWSPRILPKTILKWTKRRVSNFTYLSPREKQVDKKRFVCLNLFYSSRILNFFCSRSRPFGGSWSIRTIGEVGTWRCGSLDHESRSLHPRKTQGAPKRFVEKCVFFVGKLHWFSWKLNLIKRSDKKRNTCQMAIWNLAKDRWNRYTLYAICVSERPLGSISVPLIPSYIIQIGTLWFPGCCQQLRESG